MDPKEDFERGSGEFGQDFPDYDCSQEVGEVLDPSGKPKVRKPSGPQKAELRAAQNKRWVERNRSRRNAYMRERMRVRRSLSKAGLAAIPAWMADLD